MPRSDSETYFQCQRCTACCRWEGDVVLTDEEVTNIAQHLEMPVYDFVRKFTRLRENRTGLSLIDQDGSHDCIMLVGDRCRIQKVKPEQCRGFPNRWNFPGWREVCEAIEVKKSAAHTGE